MRIAHGLALVAAAALAVPATAGAQNDYPAPKDPGKGPAKARGKAKTLTVCKQKRCKYTTIGKAVKAATGRDTIKVKRGTYKESVSIVGSRYDGLKLIGDAKRPNRVKLDGKGLKRGKNQNGVFVNNADGVTVKGFHARNYKANCFFAVNVDGYLLTKLVAERCGVYGVYAFNSKGGEMSNSEAYYNSDSGFYVGQTPPQKGKKKRTIVRNVDSWGNVLGFSGTNMRYVTITKSRWYNNGAGIVPNALDSEKYWPPQENVIADNDIFWNNFNFYYGAPFKIPETSAADLTYPIGIGVLLLGSQDTVIERNRFDGNWLAAFSEIPAINLISDHPGDAAFADAATLKNNVVRGNDFGGGGADLNGRDMVYDGSGSGNCFEGNTVRSPNVPASNSTFAPCPGPAANTNDPNALAEALGYALSTNKSDPASFEKFWLRHPHAARKGYTPLERYTGK